jgi:hypothetical protein
MSEEKNVDAFGRPNDAPVVASVAPVAPTAEQHSAAPSVADGAGDDKSKQDLYREYLMLKAELENRFPEAAKRLSPADLGMSPAALQQIKDDAQNLKNAEEGKQLQQAMMGGAMGLVAGAAALSAMSDGQNPAGLGVLAPDVLAKQDSNKLPINKELDQILAKAGLNEKPLMLAGVTTDGKDVATGNLGNLATENTLPNLVAATEKSAGARAMA